MKLNQLQSPITENNFFNDDFRIWYESIVPYLNIENERIVSVKPSIAYKFQGDLYGLFEIMGFNKCYHYYLMLYNNFTNSLNYDGIQTVFKIPDLSQINLLMNIYNSTVA